MNQAKHEGADPGQKHPFLRQWRAHLQDDRQLARRSPGAAPAWDGPASTPRASGLQDLGWMQPLGAIASFRNLTSHCEHFCSPSAKAAIYKRPRAGSSCPILPEIAQLIQPCRHAYEASLCAQPAQAATVTLHGAPGPLKGPHPAQPAQAATALPLEPQPSPEAHLRPASAASHDNPTGAHALGCGGPFSDQDRHLPMAPLR